LEPTLTCRELTAKVTASLARITPSKDETREVHAGLSGAPIAEVGELPRRDLVMTVRFVGP
jgi:hypothetical protein